MNIGNRNLKVYGEYDAVVSGGGLLGLTYALELARTGSKVAIVERRSALGWEIGRARRMFDKSAVSEWQVTSRYVDEIAQEVMPESSTGKSFNAPLAELIFDRWVMEAGIDVLFHGWAIEIAEKDGVAEGLVVATREGYQLLKAPLVGETDDYGRLIAEDFVKIPASQPVCRSYFAANTAFTGTRTIQLSSGCLVELRGVGNGRIRVDITLNRSEPGSRDSEFHQAVLESNRAITNQVEGCEGAKVYYMAEEEWKQPSFMVQSGSQAGGMASSRYEGLWLAGPWLQSYGEASFSREECAVMNRFLLGETAAAASRGNASISRS